MPHLVRWTVEFGSKGLKTIAVYDGPRCTIGRVSAHRKTEKIEYPILFDCGGRMWKELGLRGYPTAFVVGRDGKVVWQGMLSGDRTRKTVRDLIDRLTRRKPARREPESREHESGKATSRKTTRRKGMPRKETPTVRRAV